MANEHHPSPVLIVAAFAAIYIVWGSAYVCNKILVTELPPFFVAGSRFMTASILLAALSRLYGATSKISKEQFLNSILAGFLFLVLGNGCLVYGLQYLDSGFSALLVAVQPIVVVAYMFLLYGQRISLLSSLGIALSCIGVAMLADHEAMTLVPGSWKGFVAIVISLLGWGYASVFVSQANMPEGHFRNTAIQMFAGGSMMLTYSLTAESHTLSLLDISPKAKWAMLYLIVMASIVTFTAFNFLLKYVSPEKVATSNYINPVVAMILGWWILQEEISTQSLFAAGILLLGVFFVNTGKTTKAQ